MGWCVYESSGVGTERLAQFGQDVGFTHDQVLIVVVIFGAGVFGIDDLVADGKFHGDAGAVARDAAPSQRR